MQSTQSLPARGLHFREVYSIGEVSLLLEPRGTKLIDRGFELAQTLDDFKLFREGKGSITGLFQVKLIGAEGRV